MALADRLPLYTQLEAVRGRPLVVYVTNGRAGIEATMEGDVIGEIMAQVQALPSDTNALDLLIVSNGGDPTVAWRIVSSIRERIPNLSVLVPNAAYSAATLVALGANEIVMHQNGNLGPVDPQITVVKNGKDGVPVKFRFGSEELASFLEYARHKVGLTDQEQVLKVFELFCTEAGAIPIGIATRSSHLSMAMGEKLLRMHMTKDGEAQRAKVIAESLNRNYFHHGYPIGCSEAKEIGLNVTIAAEPIDKLLWDIWLDIENELELRTPFYPLAYVQKNPACSRLFDPVLMLNLPANLADPHQQALLGQMINSMMSQFVVHVPATDYQVATVLVESKRLATRNVTTGKIFATRMPDFSFRINTTPLTVGWTTVSIPEAPAPAATNQGATS